MSVLSRKKARDLKENDLLDAVEILTFLQEKGRIDNPEQNYPSAYDNYAIVESVVIEDSDEPGTEHIAVIYTSEGNFAVDADLSVTISGTYPV